jgi:hypothetical protein
MGASWQRPPATTTSPEEPVAPPSASPRRIRHAIAHARHRDPAPDPGPGPNAAGQDAHQGGISTRSYLVLTHTQKGESLCRRRHAARPTVSRNHNATLVRLPRPAAGLKVKTHVKAGGIIVED